MKNIRNLAASFGAACLISSAAVAADAPMMEAYAHPTMFGSAVQEQISANANYIVGGKIYKANNQKSVVGKNNVVVDSFKKDVLTTIQENTTDKLWNPNMPILRSELAVVLAEGLSIQKTANSKYTDIQSNYWAKTWIEKALAADVMIGYPDDTFKPDQPVTKAEVFATIAKLINVPTDSTTNLYQFKGNDMKYIPTWAIGATNEVIASNLLNGVPSPSKVASEEYLSKEQVATLVGNLRQSLISGKTSVDASYLNNYTPTCIKIKLDERLSAKTSNVGDKFTAKTTDAVTISGQSFAEGSTVKGEVIEVSRPGIKNPGYLKVKFTEISCGDRSLAFPQCISQAQADKIKNPNFVARLFGFPFSTVGRVAGVVGRTAGTGVNVIGNGLEQYGDNISNTFTNTLALQPKAGLRSLGGSFITLGKGIFNTGEVLVSGAFGVLYEVTDEVKYLILPSASNSSALNPGEELTIVY